MPEIKVNITKGSTTVAEQQVEVSSNNLNDLLAALKTAKSEANSVLTKLVEESKETKQTRKHDEDEDDSGSDENVDDDDDGRVSKKPNNN